MKLSVFVEKITQGLIIRVNLIAFWDFYIFLKDSQHPSLLDEESERHVHKPCREGVIKHFELHYGKYEIQILEY